MELFPAEYHHKRLFDEPSTDPLHARPFEKRSGAPWVSTPERTLMEMLSEVGVRQSLQRARELALPWAAKLGAAQLPTGNDQPRVSRSTDGLLVLKP